MGSAEAGIEAEFLARKVHLLNEYHARLEALRVVSGSGGWETLAQEAGQVFLECAQALRGESQDQAGISPAAPGNGEPVVSARPAPSARARAAEILFEVLFEALWEAVDGHPDRSWLLPKGVLALHRAIGTRQEACVVAGEVATLELVRRASLTSRTELAREMHDRIGNGLSLAMRLLEIHTITGPPGHDAARESVLAVQNVLADTLDDLGKVISGLRSQHVSHSLRTALTAFVDSMQLPEPTVSIRVTGQDPRAPSPLLDELFLVLRECLRNVFAHARARRVVVEVEMESDGISAFVEDDGIGFDRDQARRSGQDNGLTSMTGRAQNLLGSVSFRPVPSGGTRVEVWIPIMG